MDWLYAALLGYLVGSIPFGLLLAAAAGKGDIRQIGSGNIGATNVLRTGSKWLAAATLLLDLGKGFVAVFLAAKWWPEAASVAALGAIVGHCFPVWLKFKGGKGVATMAGVCFGLAWPIGATYAVTWLAVLALTRTSSLAGMMAAVVAPVAAFFLGATALVPALGATALLVVWLHRENIARLRAGTEPKVGSKQ
jgi:glycerol-3-phosphate acyltransferase PlsY